MRDSSKDSVLPDATSVLGVLLIQTFHSHLIHIDIETSQSTDLIIVVDRMQ